MEEYQRVVHGTLRHDPNLERTTVEVRISLIASRLSFPHRSKLV